MKCSNTLWGVVASRVSCSRGNVLIQRCYSKAKPPNPLPAQPPSTKPPRSRTPKPSPTSLPPPSTPLSQEIVDKSPLPTTTPTPSSKPNSITSVKKSTPANSKLQVTHWGDALTPYVLSPTEFHPTEVSHFDEHTVVAYDKYPKAKYHMLVMPSYEVYGFDCLTIDNVPMLEEIRDRGLALIDEIRAKEPELSFRMGFHAIPSLKQLHMHVISQDFESTHMKKKQTWNSFNTDYFVDANLFINHLQSEGYIFLDRIYYEDELKKPLLCAKCTEEFKNLPNLKSHINSCGAEAKSG